MFQPRFYRTKSPKNRKAGSTYSVELPLPKWMVKSFCSPKWVESMKEKHSKKIKFTLKPPDESKGDDESKEDETKGGELWTLTATGKHNQTMRNVGSDMIDRYNKMIGVIQNIVKE